MPLKSEAFDRWRREMVKRQIAGRGICDPRVQRAMEEVPRHLFVPRELRAHAYEDTPLPIGSRQTISQPYIVAAMVEALQLPEFARVLEIGTGSGYAAAILGRIAADVVTIERFEDLAAEARAVLKATGAGNVRVFCADGTLGWPAEAPYDGILVDAAGPVIPAALKAQLAVGGRLVMPLEIDARQQELVRVVRRDEDEFTRERLFDVRFVPLIGEQGFAPDSDR